MPSITNITISSLAHDSSRGVTNYAINCMVDGQRASVFGAVPVRTPGDQKESEVTAASKAAVADFLQALSGQIRSLP